MRSPLLRSGGTGPDDDVPRDYHSPGFVQSIFIWRRWEHEAARLFGLYWRSGELKHFAAFVRHVAAMRLSEDLASEPRREIISIEFRALTDTKTRDISVERVLDDIDGGKKLKGGIKQFKMI